MKILGIDPGTATVGFGLIEAAAGRVRMLAAGVITTPPADPMPLRLATIYSELGQLLAEFRPDAAAIELLYFAANVTTGIQVGQARGVILLAAQQAGVDIAEYTPLQIKLAISGYGRATKPQMQDMVKLLLKLPAIPRPDDAADGLAVALTHAQSFKNPA